MFKQFIRITLSLLAACAIAIPAAAAPKVVTDIPAVHALAAKAMEGVGAPVRLLPPGASPHGYHMRPSEASALAEADILIWIGPELTPWLDRARRKLNAKAPSLALLGVPGTTRHEAREEAVFTAHADGGHDHGHHHGPVDPHAWLDPVNGARWLGAIARALGSIDPANAGTYTANAAAGEAELWVLKEALNAELAPVRNQPYVVLHDGFQYFEDRFRISALGAIRLSDGAAPSPRRLATLRRGIKAGGARCIFREPQYSSALAAGLAGPDVRTGVLDPLGWDLEAGWSLYPTLLQQLGTNLRQCLE
jgi:zinc transport system substrate-binding protein